MTILFSDIRSFTTMSEKMTVSDTFDFLNEYFEHVGPTIRAHNGFIDKYIGDAVMALFAGDADDAVAAAIELQDQVRRFNEKRLRMEYRAINVGIGLHRGQLMLGTVGEAERYDTTVIADSVNVAARLEELTKVFKIPILVSGEVVRSLGDPSRFHFRYLGKTMPRGTSRLVDLFEALDADPHSLAIKNATKADFDAAVSALDAGRRDQAVPLLELILRTTPEDTVAEYLLNTARDVKISLPVEV